MCPEFQARLQNKLVNVYGYYEKHTLRRVKYEKEELLHETQDERRFGNISYYEFLDKLENGSIKPEDLGTKM